MVISMVVMEKMIDYDCVITMYKHVVYDVQFIIGPNVYSGISFLWKSHVYKL